MYVTKGCFAGWDVATGQWYMAGAFSWFAHPKDNSVSRSGWAKIMAYGNDSNSNSSKRIDFSNNISVSGGSRAYSAPVFVHASPLTDSLSRSRQAAAAKRA